jgi:hypothetical protein
VTATVSAAHDRDRAVTRVAITNMENSMAFVTQ